MKRMISLCFGCILVFFLTFNTCYANSNSEISLEELNKNESEYSEIIHLEDKIKAMLGDFMGLEGKVLPDNLEINFESAIKIYIDSDIFSLETSDKEAVIKKLEKSDYVWLLPVIVGGETYEVNIATGLPLDESDEEIMAVLTEEQIWEIKANEGKWSISGISLYEEEIIDYERIITKALDATSYDDVSQIVICGGLKHIHQPIALVMDDDNVKLLIPLYDLEVAGTEAEIANVKPDSAGKEDEVYLYEGIMEAVNHMGSLGKDESGSGARIILSSEIPVTESSATKSYMIWGVVIIFVLLSSFTVYHMVNKKYSLIRGDKS